MAILPLNQGWASAREMGRCPAAITQQPLPTCNCPEAIAPCRYLVPLLEGHCLLPLSSSHHVCPSPEPQPATTATDVQAHLCGRSCAASLSDPGILSRGRTQTKDPGHRPRGLLLEGYRTVKPVRPCQHVCRRLLRGQSTWEGQ